MTEDNKLHGFYRGQVLEHLTHGYCRIFIPGIYPTYFKEHIKMIPPAEQAASLFGGANTGNGTFTYPNLSSVVWCFFANGDQNMPVYFASSLGGENAFGQYSIIKTNNELCSTRHLITTGKTQVEFFENGKMYCVVKDPDRREAKVEYKSLNDITQLTNDSVSEYPIVNKVENYEISSIDCQFILDNDMNCHGISQVKSQFYDTKTTDESNYKLSIVNNYTMKNDGLVDIDSTSSYNRNFNNGNNSEQNDVHVKNNLDMNISSGICLQNSFNTDTMINNTESTVKKESYNKVIINDNGISVHTNMMSVTNESPIIKTYDSNSFTNYGHPGYLALSSQYATNVKNSSTNSEHYKTSIKALEFGSNAKNAITNEKCDTIQTSMLYQTRDVGDGCTKNVKLNVADSTSVFDTEKTSGTAYASRDKVMSFTSESKCQDSSVTVKISEHEGSDGNIITAMNYSSTQDQAKETAVISQAITKDRGFNSNIDFTMKDFGQNIKSSAYRATFASSNGDSKSNSNSVKGDGFAFDTLKLTSSVNNYGTLDADCTLESTHSTEKATYTEKITNNLSKEKFQGDITIDAKSGYIMFSANDTNGNSSSITLTKSGNIVLNATGGIQLNAPLLCLNSELQTLIKSQNGEVLINTHNYGLVGDIVTLSASKAPMNFLSPNGNKMV